MRAGEDTHICDICWRPACVRKTPRTWRGVRRVPQYLIASGYECCLDTSEIARREGLESDVETGNRKEGREAGELVRCLARNLAVITLMIT